jgi:GWxTD domain-containing protein
MARGKTVAKRIERILNETQVSPKISWGLRLLLISTVFPLVVLSAGMRAHEERKPLSARSIAMVSVAAQIATPGIESRVPRAQSLAAASVPRSPRRESRAQGGILENWIDQEVPDIATSGERAAFMDLKTIDAREQFIAQFWLKRDPTPGTAANEFRDEYFRRIVMANQRYSTATVQGWMTDRGRVFVMFGSPDEVEIHAQGGTYRRPAQEGGGETQTFPFELWRYRSIEGIGRNVMLEFVDTDRTGTYRLSLGQSEAFNLLAPR